MPKITQLATYVALALLASAAAARSDPLAAIRIASDELKWERAATGIDRANIVGNERNPGIYLYRVRFPAGAKVQPHFHPDERAVTVLSGTLYMGYGDRFDQAAMKALPAGSVWTEPAKQPHFVWAKDGEVVIQVFGANGPSGVTPVESK